MAEPASGEILIYQSEAGETRLEVRLARETVCLTQKLMAELFQMMSGNTLIRFKSMCEDNELDDSATTKNYLAVRFPALKLKYCNKLHGAKPAKVMSGGIRHEKR